MNDEFFMDQAISLALKAKGLTSPNPLVGAVIVRDGKVVGKGYHQKAGESHAEINAIKDAFKNKNSLKGATLYVNLEPCCHFGRTPPCVSEIVDVGISRVVVAHKDPFSRVNGKGISFLKKAGIDVSVGVLEKEARAINQPFLKVSATGMPFVTLKAGMTLDGKISTGYGKSEWITSETSRIHGHKLRDCYDAIVVGANTVIVDNPVLAAKGKNLLRVIIDGNLRTKVSSKVYRDGNVLIACSMSADEKKVRKFEKAGVNVFRSGKDSVDIKKLLGFLYQRHDVLSVFVEGGSETHGSFFDAGVVDDVYFYISPELIGGGKSLSVIGGKGVKSIKNSLKIKNLSVTNLDGDILVHGIVNEY